MDGPKEGGDAGREGSNGERGDGSQNEKREEGRGRWARVVVGPLEGGGSHITAEQH